MSDVAEHKAEKQTRDWYPIANRIWSHIITVQITLVVAGHVTGDKRLSWAALLFGVLAIVVGLPVLNEWSKRREQWLKDVS